MGKKLRIPFFSIFPVDRQLDLHGLVRGVEEFHPISNFNTLGDEDLFEFLLMRNTINGIGGLRQKGHWIFSKSFKRDKHSLCIYVFMIVFIIFYAILM